SGSSDCRTAPLHCQPLKFHLGCKHGGLGGDDTHRFSHSSSLPAVGVRGSGSMRDIHLSPIPSASPTSSTAPRPPLLDYSIPESRRIERICQVSWLGCQHP
uniref:Uncharacterized protein n=1 Tax=Denticeps clupeoides TaxID=299321 RepID=A0AAY4D239_9TELE